MIDSENDFDTIRDTVILEGSNEREELMKSQTLHIGLRFSLEPRKWK